MPIIDSQVHAYEANTPKRPWHSVPNWPPSATGDEMVAAMDKLGIDGAIFISAFSIYGYDASYAVEVQRKHPGRFAIVKPVNPDDPAVADVIADWKKTPGAVGIRIIVTKEPGRNPSDAGLDRVLREAVRHDFPVNILCWGNLERGTAVIDRQPDVRFIIDHLGILQPRVGWRIPHDSGNGLTFGAAHLGALHFIAQAVPEDRAATAQGLYAAVTAGIAMGGGMLAAGPLYAQLGGRGYLVMAGVAAISAVAAMVLNARWRGGRLLAPRGEASDEIPA